MSGKSLSFDLKVTIAHEGEDLWSATCTPCGHKLAWCVQRDELPMLVTRSIAHVCGEQQVSEALPVAVAQTD